MSQHYVSLLKKRSQPFQLYSTQAEFQFNLNALTNNDNIGNIFLQVQKTSFLT